MVRQKQRYILSEIITDPELLPKQRLKLRVPILLECVRSQMRKIHGDYGLAVLQRSLVIKYVNEETRMILFRSKRGVHTQFLQALALVNNIDGLDAFFNTIHVSGTLRSCYKYLKSYDKQELIRLRRASDDPEQKKVIQSQIEKHREAEKRRKNKRKNKDPNVTETGDILATESDPDSD